MKIELTATPEASPIFTKLRVGPLELANRIVMTAMATPLAPATGELSERTNRYFLERAKGGAGLIILPATGWTRMDAAHPSVPYERVQFYREDRWVGHQRLLDELKRTGVMVGIQLNHRGRQSTRKLFGCVPVSASALPWSPKAECPEPLSVPDIQNLVDRFGRAAAIAKRIGFDLVEIHAGHGYLFSNFLSPGCNLRDDEYGGHLSNRARFLLETIARLRCEVGSNFPVLVRINGDDFTERGLKIEESEKIAQHLETWGVDCISISGGVNGSWPLSVPTHYMEPGCFVHLAERIKRWVKIPVLVAGRLGERKTAEKILKKGKGDLIGLGRPLLADPLLPQKWKEGGEQDVRKCLACNQCLDAYWKGEVSCLINPTLGKEKEFEIRATTRGKKVWVIGAGVAGLEAAWRASIRGHSVTLFDGKKKPGGQWVLASLPPGKDHYRGFLDYLIRRVDKSDVKIVLGKRIGPKEILRENPDSVIVATGPAPEYPIIDGLTGKECLPAWEILRKKIPPGKRYLVIGGGAIGLEVAHWLIRRGKEVTVAEMTNRFGADLGETIRWDLMNILRKSGARLIPNLEIVSVEADFLSVREAGVLKLWKKFNVHVVATGRSNRNARLRDLSGYRGDLHVIGDAREPRSGLFAIREGAEIGNTI